MDREHTISSAMLDALRAVLAEVTPGVRPYSTDSWLPPHVVEQVRAAVADAEKRAA